MTTQVVVWCVWWPAWVIGLVLLFGSPRDDGDSKEEIREVKNAETKGHIDEKSEGKAERWKGKASAYQEL